MIFFFIFVFLNLSKINGHFSFEIASTLFNSQNEIEVDSSIISIILKNYKYNGKLKCLSNCFNLIECQFVGFNSSTCLLYSEKAEFHLVERKDIYLFSKYNPK